MLATNTNWKDVQKYYQGTFIKLRELGEVPLLVDRVTDKAIWGIKQDGEKVELVLCEEGYDLDYCIPKKTVYQCGEFAYIIERVPARMWRKGWSSENSVVSVIGDNGSFSKVNWDINAVAAFVNKPAYCNLEDLRSGYISVALNNRFYAYKNFIGVDESVIGVFDLNKQTIYYRKLFEREIRNLFAMKNYKLVGI